MRELFRTIEWEKGITPEFRVDPGQTAFTLQYDGEFFWTLESSKVGYIVCQLIDKDLIDDKTLDDYLYNVDKNNLPEDIYRSVCEDKEGFLIIK